MVNDNKPGVENNLVHLPLLFPVHHGLPATETLSLSVLSLWLQRQTLDSTQASILQDSRHILSSHPLSRHGPCYFVLRYMFEALAHIPTALGYMSCSSLLEKECRSYLCCDLITLSL